MTMAIRLKLAPYESLVAVAGDALAHELATGRPRECGGMAAMEVAGPWSVAIAASEQYPVFEAWQQVHELTDLSAPGQLPDFSGTFRYEASFLWQPANAGLSVELDLGGVYEIAQAWVNGTDAGIRLCPPYRLPIGHLVRPGANELVIEVTNTLVREQLDPFSRFAPLEPSGLLGPVQLIYPAGQRK